MINLLNTQLFENHKILKNHKRSHKYNKTALQRVYQMKSQNSIIHKAKNQKDKFNLSKTLAKRLIELLVVQRILKELQ